MKKMTKFLSVIFLGSLFLNPLSANDYNDYNDCNDCFEFNDGIAIPTNPILKNRLSTKISNKEFYINVLNTCPGLTSNEKIYFELNRTRIDSKTGNCYTESKIVSIEDPTIRLFLPENVLKLKVKDSWNIAKISIDYNLRQMIYPFKIVSKKDSSDTFAVRPDHFRIKVFKSSASDPTVSSTSSTSSIPSIPAGNFISLKIEALDYQGNVVTYDKSTDDYLTIELSPGNKIQFIPYNIKNGQGLIRMMFSLSAEDQEIKLIDETFSNIDINDSLEDQRYFEGKVNLRISERFKSWCGTGTGEKENDPNKNTVQPNIRNNVNKNLQYHKMQW